LQTTIWWRRKNQKRDAAAAVAVAVVAALEEKEKGEVLEEWTEGVAEELAVVAVAVGKGGREVGM
jgi:hypothetical protein